jgi:excisionase family DNA binding protein
MDEQRDEKRIERGSVRTAAGVAPLLLTIPQAAAVLAVGRTTVYKLVGAGDLEAVHIGRSVRIPVSTVEEFVERQYRSGRQQSAARAKQELDPGQPTT